MSSDQSQTDIQIKQEAPKTGTDRKVVLFTLLVLTICLVALGVNNIVLNEKTIKQNDKNVDSERKKNVKKPNITTNYDYKNNNDNKLQNPNIKPLPPQNTNSTIKPVPVQNKTNPKPNILPLPVQNTTKPNPNILPTPVQNMTRPNPNIPSLPVQNTTKPNPNTQPVPYQNRIPPAPTVPNKPVVNNTVLNLGGIQKPLEQKFEQTEYQRQNKFNISMKLSNIHKKDDSISLLSQSTIKFGLGLNDQISVNLNQLQDAFNYIKLKKAQMQPLYCPSKIWQDNRNVQMYKKRYTLVNTRYGFKMYIDGYDKYISYLIHKDGVWEQKIVYILGKLMKPGFKILNLGAQSGIQAIIMSKIIGPQGRIYLFEPYSVSFNILKKNMQINNLMDQVQLYNIGAHDHKFKTNLFISYRNTAGNTILKSSIQVPTDYYVQQISLDRVQDVIPSNIVFDFALIDVERVQVEALNGMIKIIERSPNMILLIQWGNKSDKNSARQMGQYFINKGYKLYTYRIFSNIQCKMGVFTQININQLLSFTIATDVWFFPQGFSPPK